MLTRDNVRTLPAESGRRTTYRDDVVRGLELRVSPTGDRSFSFRYSHRGQDRRHPIGKVKLRDDYDQGLTLKQARDKADEIRGRVAQGKDPAVVRMLELRTPPAASPAVMTVEQMVREAVARFDIVDRTRREHLRTAEHDIFPVLGARAVDQVTRAELKAWMRAQTDRAPVQANRSFGLLRSCFNWAVGEEALKASPFFGLKELTREKPTERCLSTVEVRCLLAGLKALADRRSDVVRLLLLTAARLDMVVSATREEFELEGKEPRWAIPAERMKGKKRHVVPLSPQAVELLRHLPARGHLFPHEGPPRKHGEPELNWGDRYASRLRFELAFAWAREQGKEIPKRPSGYIDREAVTAFVPHWTVHNIRHTIGTHLTEDLNVPEPVVSLILSHAPEGPAVSRKYNLARRLPQRRTALSAWADWLDWVEGGAAEESKILPFPSVAF